METKRSLGEGTLGTSNVTLYSPGQNRAAKITLITIVNSGASSQTVSLYKRTSRNTQIPLFAPLTEVGSNYTFQFDGEMFLAAGEAIFGLSDSAANVTYIVDGIEYEQLLTNQLALNKI